MASLLLTHTHMTLSRFASVFVTSLVLAAGAGCAAEEGAESEDEINTGKLTPADVSILLPLPKSNANESLAATAKGKGGDELVPQTAYKLNGMPLQKVLHPGFYPLHGAPNVDTEAEERAVLRLTAVRVDPCGRTKPSDPEARCVPEIRLVFQPVLATAEGVFEAADGAIHAFYRVSEGELRAFTKAMFDARNVGGRFSYTSLGVHPTLAKEGLTGAFAKELYAQVKKVCGGGNLERVTFLQRTAAREPVWVFGITSVTNKVAKVETIATTSSTRQVIEGPGLSLPMHLTGLEDGEAPTETASPDKIGALLDRRTTSEAEQVKALNASLRIDNPLIHSPETMACVECHVASGTRKSALAEKPQLKDRIDPANVFKAPMTARHVASKDVGNLHSFSWKGTDPGVSDRAANDSAQIAARMNKLLF